MSDNGQQVPLIERLRVSDPHDSNLRRAADFCRDLGRDALAEAVSRAIDRIAELEAMCATQAETIAGLNRLLDGVAVAIVGKTRLFADLPEMREEGKG